MSSEKRVEWSGLALSRLEEIAAFISEDKPSAAYRWLLSIFDAGDSLHIHAERGRVVPELGRSEIRELIHEGYRIVYRLEEARVLILTVRHGRQLLHDDLEEGPG